MNYGFLKTLVLYAALAAFSLGIGQGLVNAFSYDIFDRCITGDVARDSFFCTSGPQVAIDAVTALLFVAFALIVFGQGAKAIKTKKLIQAGVVVAIGMVAVTATQFENGSAGVGLTFATLYLAALYLLANSKDAATKLLPKFVLIGGIFFVLAILSWRMQLNLQDNFRHFSSPIFAGPDSLTDYFYILFLLLDTIFIGLILGLIAWLPQRLNAMAIPANKRDEPREDFRVNKAKKPTKKSSAGSKK